ncbi:MAG: hypothetical protein GXP10_01940 [Gammaproteobacteria bacterium]|nr:hypothetical protein [Gammaproteobacteria bacterium]
MTNAIIHIGAGKCGSSALQTVLSQDFKFEGGGNGLVEYAAVRPDGLLLSGEGMLKLAASNPYGYCSSVNAAEIASLSRSKRKVLAKRLSGVCGSSGCVVLSNEGWINESELFKSSDVLQSLKLKCHAVCYVRPPVEWINSAWWQWGAWTGAPFPRWLNGNLMHVRWFEKIEKWQDVKGVEKLTVRLLPKDIVSDFCGVLGVRSPQENRSNVSLPASVLRLYQRHRYLRPDPHSSAIDFVLARYLNGGVNDPTPWVLGPKVIERIIEKTRQSNLRLLTLLDENSKAKIKEDPRWWDPTAFSFRQKEPPMAKKVNPEKLEAIAVQALRAIWELDQENRQLRQKIDAQL